MPPECTCASACEMTAIELWEEGAYKQRQEEYFEEEESDNEFGDPEGYVDDITDEGNSDFLG